MNSRTRNLVTATLASLTVSLWGFLAISLKAQSTHPFSVADDIGLTQVGDIWTGSDTEPKWSPDGEWIALHLTSASLEDGLLHDRIVIYSAAQLRERLRASIKPSSSFPAPFWEIKVVAKPNDWSDPACESVSWLNDSSGIAFLQWTQDGTRQLKLASIANKQVSSLSPLDQDVLSFAIHDRHHFVYTLPSESYTADQVALMNEPYRVVTGQRVSSILYPQQNLKALGRGDLWTSDARGGTHPVLDPETRKPVFLYGRGIYSLSLSNDGQSLATYIPMSEVPSEWENQYPPPYRESPIRLHGGTQDLTVPFSNSYVSQIGLVSLETGRVTILVNSPDAMVAGWFEGANTQAVWSADDHSLFLPGVFLETSAREERRPCYAEMDLISRKATCIRAMHGTTATGREMGYSRVLNAQFSINKQEITLFTSEGTETFARSGDGKWSDSHRQAHEVHEFDAKIVATPQSAPRFVVRDRTTHNEATVLELDPQLQNVKLGDVVPYRWGDGLNHQWEGFLYLPVDYEPGKRYPLVIQNHGVMKGAFAPSGEFPSAFAAQELASVGIMVLQVQDCSGRGTPREIECNVSAYDAAVGQLSREGKIDPAAVGLIGFSRTVAYVLSSLIKGKVHYKAASITDGFDIGIMNYAYVVSSFRVDTDEFSALVGAPPIGPGLLKWLENAPDLNVDKIDTPLRVVAKKEAYVIPMWEPFALLKASGKPAEFVVLNTREHVINDPRVRSAAQQGNVDWFRFWLQNWEDPSPGKSDQYRRWRELRSTR